jgi:hypothetical protein
MFYKLFLHHILHFNIYVINNHNLNHSDFKRQELET